MNQEEEGSIVQVERLVGIAGALLGGGGFVPTVSFGVWQTTGAVSCIWATNKRSANPFGKRSATITAYYLGKEVR